MKIAAYMLLSQNDKELLFSYGSMRGCESNKEARLSIEQILLNRIIEPRKHGRPVIAPVLVNERERIEVILKQFYEWQYKNWYSYRMLAIQEEYYIAVLEIPAYECILHLPDKGFIDVDLEKYLDNPQASVIFSLLKKTMIKDLYKVTYVQTLQIAVRDPKAIRISNHITEKDFLKIKEQNVNVLVYKVKNMEEREEDVILFAPGFGVI